MKKNKLLNSQISLLIAELGHTDTIVIGDVGLPIPEGVKRIDLALVRGVPSFKEVLEAVLSEMAVESYITASEAEQSLDKLCKSLLPEASPTKIPHSELKKICRHAKAVIRTGECYPYYNIILSSNVAF